MVSASRLFLAYVILPVWPGPLPLLSRGGAHASAPHWIHSWASPNKRVTIEKQAHAMGKIKDLYSAYCPTGGCTLMAHSSVSSWTAEWCVRESHKRMNGFCAAEQQEAQLSAPRAMGTSFRDWVTLHWLPE